MAQTAKQRRQAHGEAMDAKFGESELVASASFNTGPIVAVPGPGRFSNQRYNNNEVFGWPKGHGAVCACMDCKKAFKIDDDHPAMKEADIVECPDCGAMSVLSVKQSYYSDGDYHRTKDGRMEITVPSERRLYVSNPEKPGDPVRAKDSIAYRTASFGPPVIRGEGDDQRVKLDMRFGGEVRQITYDSSKRAIMRSGETADGRRLQGLENEDQKPTQAAVIGIPPQREKNTTRKEWVGGYISHDTSGTSADQHKLASMDAEFTSAMYAKVCAKPLGLPVPSSERQYGRAGDSDVTQHLTQAEQQRMVYMAVQYPGVVERELGRINENLKYAKEPVPPERQAQMRYEALNSTMDKLTAMDSRLAHDLHMCKTGAEVDAKLRSVTFGDQSQQQGQHIRLDTAMEGVEDRAFKGKFLKKEFNKDPYVAAANVYTCQKLGVRDVNHMQQVFELGKQDGYVHGIAAPIETQDMMQFSRVYMKSRDTTTALKDLFPPDGDRRIMVDTASMYHELMTAKKAKVALTNEDVRESQYQNTLRQMHRYFSVEGHSPETAMQEASFQRAWGDKTAACVEHFYQQYQQNPEQAPQQMFVPRSGKGLLDSNMNIKEIHDELSLISNSVNSTAVYRDYNYSDSERAALNYSGENLNFHLCKSNAESCEVGTQLEICTGHYQDKWDPSNRSGSYLVVVEDKTSGTLGCIEVTKQRDPENGGYKPYQVHQIKAHNNHTFPGYSDDIVEYMRHAGIVDEQGAPKFSSDGKKDFDEIGKDVFRYGNHNFAYQGPMPVREQPDIICKPADIQYHLDYVAQKQAEAERQKAENEAKKAAIKAAKQAAASVKDAPDAPSATAAYTS